MNELGCYSRIQAITATLRLEEKHEGNGTRDEGAENEGKGEDEQVGNQSTTPGITEGGGKNGSKKLIQCKECLRVFSHKNSLVYHQRSHTGERKYGCEVCGKKFFATSALNVHKRLHSGEKPYSCDVCGKVFRQWGDLSYHKISIHSNQRVHQCEFCGKDFARKYSLVVHRRIHTGEKKYSCDYCKMNFSTASYLQTHRRVHTGEKPHACTICGKSFRISSDLKRHMLIHNREKQVIATVLTDLGNDIRANIPVPDDVNTVQPENASVSDSLIIEQPGILEPVPVIPRIVALADHVAIPPDPLPMEPEVKQVAGPPVIVSESFVVNTPPRISEDDTYVEQKVTTPPSFELMQLYADEGIYDEDGNDGFQNMEDGEDRDEADELRDVDEDKNKADPVLSIQLEAEKQDGMDKGSVSLLKCNVCSKVFAHKNSLMYHQRSHTGERPYGCDTCGKRFFATSALKVHMRLHSGVKPYSCDICGNQFRQSGDLSHHKISIHSSERAHQCEFCGKNFARKYSLVIHQRIHTNERNYKCEFCPMSFRAASYLQSHRRIHTGEKPYDCLVCGKNFRVRSDLNRHKKTHNRKLTTVAVSAGVSIKPASEVPSITPRNDGEADKLVAKEVAPVLFLMSSDIVYLM